MQERREGATYDIMLTPEERELTKEGRQFVLEEVTGDFLRNMDKDHRVAQELITYNA